MVRKLTKNLWTVAALAILLATTACSSSSSPDKASVSIVMGDKVTTLRAFASSINGNGVTVLGAIATPDPCYNFTASVTTTGNVIEATVKAVSQNTGCAVALNRQNYTLTLSTVPTGTWTIRVMHQEDAKTPLLQYETTLTIK